MIIDELMDTDVRYECWKKDFDFPKYEFSSQGRVRSRHSGEWRLLKPFKVGNAHKRPWCDDRYFCVYLYKDGKSRKIKIGTRMLQLFYGPRLEYSVTRHGVRGKWCDQLSNLQLGSQRQNILDRRRDGTVPDHSGVNNPNSKVSHLELQSPVQRHNTGETYVVIARDYPVTPERVSQICRNMGAMVSGI